jgi:hypothetical protein
MRIQSCRGRNSRGEFTRFILCYLVKIHHRTGKHLNRLSEPEDLPGSRDLHCSLLE